LKIEEKVLNLKDSLIKIEIWITYFLTAKSIKGIRSFINKWREKSKLWLVLKHKQKKNIKLYQFIGKMVKLILILNLLKS